MVICHRGWIAGYQFFSEPGSVSYAVIDRHPLKVITGKMHPRKLANKRIEVFDFRVMPGCVLGDGPRRAADVDEGWLAAYAQDSLEVRHCDGEEVFIRPLRCLGVARASHEDPEQPFTLWDMVGKDAVGKQNPEQGEVFFRAGNEKTVTIQGVVDGLRVETKVQYDQRGGGDAFDQLRGLWGEVVQQR